MTCLEVLVKMEVDAVIKKKKTQGKESGKELQQEMIYVYIQIPL